MQKIVTIGGGTGHFQILKGLKNFECEIIAIVNIGKLSKETVADYFSENSKIVEDDLLNDSRVVRGEFATEYPSEPKTILRHVPNKKLK